MGEEMKSDLAGQGFLRLLQELRTVFLHDSALDPRVWKKALFTLPEYDAFAQVVIEANNEREESMDVQLRNVLPVVAERLAISQQYVNGAGGLLGQPEFQGPASHHGYLERLDGGPRSPLCRHV